MMRVRPMSEAWIAIMLCAARQGACNLAATPGLHWCRIDADWSAKINPHSETVDKIPPYGVLVEWRGMPAGIVSRDGGTLVRSEAFTEASLIAACGGIEA